MKAEERIEIFHGGPFVSFPRLEGTPTTQAVEEGVKRVLLSFASASNSTWMPLCVNFPHRNSRRDAS